MRNILTIINLTLQETFRRKIVILIFLITIFLISATFFLPAIDESGKLKLVQTWSYRSISLFGIILILVLAALSISDDIESRRIFLINSKPISSSSFILGKFLGFLSISFLFIVITFVISTIYIRIVSFFLREQVVEECLRPKSSIYPTILKFVSETDDQKNSIVTINDSTSKIESKGEVNDFIVWRFSDIPVENIPAKVVAVLKTTVGEIVGDKVIFNQTALKFILRNPKTNEMSHTLKLNVLYKRKIRFSFNKKYISNDGKLDVLMSRTNSESMVRVSLEDLYIESVSKSFEWNFFKSLISVFVQMMIIVSIALLCSTFLSSMLSLSMTFIIYIIGNIFYFTQQSLPYVEKIIREYSHNIHPIIPYSKISPVPLWALKASQLIVNIITPIIPDFSKLSVVDMLLNNTNIPESIISSHLIYGLKYCIFALIVSITALSLREYR